MKTKLILSTLLLGAVISCKKDEPVEQNIPNEEEVITTLNYTLTNTNDQNDVVVLTWEDLDGDGSGTPVITGDTLKSNATYNGSMELLNKTVDPNDDEYVVTAEILEEDNEHQFFFEASSSTITVNYLDVDENNLPVGLETELTTTNAGTVDLTVTLIHEPKKPNDGTLADAGGSEDVSVVFPITIED